MEGWGQTYRKAAKVKNLALKQQEATNPWANQRRGIRFSRARRHRLEEGPST